MKHNIGKMDRMIRSTVGMGIIYAFIRGAMGGPIAVILGLFAVMLIATAVFGYCPPYKWLGINTNKSKKQD
jgi:hypothetical protein